MKIAIMGFGTIGEGVARVISENRRLIEKRVNTEVDVKYVLDLREFPDSPFGGLIIHDFDKILKDDEISVVVETMGGLHPAYEYTKAALEAGKYVVTANKAVVAAYGVELLAVAEEHGVRYLFEASVGGGIPIIRPMMNSLTPVNIRSISGILNGTTNYMLTRMKNEGVGYAEVLADAQALGYAERDPSADVEGYDAARKIAILAAIATDKLADLDAVHCEGITKVTETDMAIAESFGCTVKLIARFEDINGKLLLMVSPRFVRDNCPLYTVNDVLNGILVDSDMLGDTMFYGKGAGKLPTAGAVVADVLDVAVSGENIMALRWTEAKPDDIADFDEYSCRRAVTVKDAPDAMKTIEKYFTVKSSLKKDGLVAFTTDEMTEKAVKTALDSCGLEVVAAYRML